MALRRSTLGLNTLIVAPHVQAALGPVCLTCGRVVDSEELVEGYPGESTHAKVLVKHHGAEELRTFEMGSTNWDERDLGSMMRRTNWFDPNSYEDAGLGVRVINPTEAQPNDDDAKPMIVVPK